MESLQLADSLELEMVKVTIGIRVYPDTEIAHHAKQIGHYPLMITYCIQLYRKWYGGVAA